ncbi:lipolytic protein G-D-S-L family [Oscillatoria nigro-viridis PCC 7112]|uniref:Lipolytic protein G-D-S-L family n=1 Tax=Phormidium nigroviride PCC 7112 TaxID=179408 RepID=K9VCB5_9CYAN|nr:GDSL-type esterase/lipase family protein [Oscillatoria nigro-viridis]AFZ05813.1 lipolytic protein G-D-S-L family [Oscillatoria nigro-viridis PCC 7112]
MQVATAYSFGHLHRGNSHPLKLVAFGDSLIYGFGDGVGGGWVERLRRQWMLPESAGHVLYNLGVRGDRAYQVSQRLENEFRHRGELRNRVPDAIILSVGLNDSARVQSPTGRSYTDFEHFKTVLDHLLNLSQQLCPVIFVGMVPVDESKMPFQDCLYYSHADQYRYKEATKLACQLRGIPYLDIFDKWINRGSDWWRSRLIADGLHPNAAGYQSLFEDVTSWEPLASISH